MDVKGLPHSFKYSHLDFSVIKLAVFGWPTIGMSSTWGCGGGGNSGGSGGGSTPIITSDKATLNFPTGLIIDAQDNLFFADSRNNVIQRVINQ